MDYIKNGKGIVFQSRFLTLFNELLPEILTIETQGGPK